MQLLHVRCRQQGLLFYFTIYTDSRGKTVGFVAFFFSLIKKFKSYLLIEVLYNMLFMFQKVLEHIVVLLTIFNKMNYPHRGL